MVVRNCCKKYHTIIRQTSVLYMFACGKSLEVLKNSVVLHQILCVIYILCLLYCFGRDCLKSAVEYNEEATLKCPFKDDSYSCSAPLQEREIKAVSIYRIQYPKWLTFFFTSILEL